ncbi:glycosyltransferase [Paraflavitalea sp. CAU 1676]|uniref:glycosyltransferase family 2 protein n=1 Tax=Paraflavitalea sp. CAU 1676 TaxID=3032598 RepID=UPI0023D98EF3|nr:glycosyltransferase [Paraflavitalea sp. CAU 1676]MDF2188771.1 glycosyltransferase [Paraflavitalea sp. CAU 1676]
MSTTVFISICIPAYKNTDYLRRALDAVAIQTFRDFEVVVTDDSPDESVASLVKTYQHQFPLRYQRNIPALGSPGNWNAGIHLASGQWIKMMHDDDWFAGANSLQQFAEAAIQTNAPFLYSGYTHVEEASGKQLTVLPLSADINGLRRNPDRIIAFNVIGHPSTTMVRNDQELFYDENLKWLVDVEYYHRLLRQGPFHAILAPIVNIGMNAHQITKAVFRQPEVEIPENLYVLNKLGLPILRSATVYDHFWRMLRNLQVRDKQTLEQYNGANQIPKVICTMVNHQRRWPVSLLKIGPFSKTLMLLSWLWTGITRQRQGS